MPTPVFVVDSAATPDREFLTRAAAASALNMSITSVSKLVRANILSLPISAAVIDELSRRPQLRVIEGELTVLRTDARTASLDPDDDREFLGFHTEQTDAEIEEACLRWWRSSPARILDNELWAVTVSTIPVAVFQITDHLDQTDPSAGDLNRHRYGGKLLARMHPGLGEVKVRESTPGHLRAGVAQIMKSRIEVSSGGPIGYLTSE